MKLGYPELDLEPLDKFEDMLQSMHIDHALFREFGYPMTPSTPFLENWMRRLISGERFIFSFNQVQNRLCYLTPNEETDLSVTMLPPDFPLAEYIWRQLKLGQRVLVQGKVFQDKVMRGIVTVYTGK